MTRRLGLLGGTLDPVHYGHLDAARAALGALALDEVLFVPAHDPPHRAADPFTSAFHRFALVALAIEGGERLRVSDLELRRDGPSYTIDTLRHLHREGWRPAELVFIIGADAFAEIASWREYPAVLDAASFAVVSRPGMTAAAAVAKTPGLETRVRDAGAERTAIFPIEANTRAVSSTAIRERIARGQAIDDLVPPAVARHIEKHRLYGAVGHLHG